MKQVEERGSGPNAPAEGRVAARSAQRSFSWWRALILAVAILLLRPSLVVAKVILYSPVGWVALWLVLIVGYLWLHPRKRGE